MGYKNRVYSHLFQATNKFFAAKFFLADAIYSCTYLLHMVYIKNKGAKSIIVVFKKFRFLLFIYLCVCVCYGVSYV